MALEQCVTDLLKRNLPLRLQLGCGANILPGWINTDVQASGAGVELLDFTQRLPFHDGTLAAVFLEHTIEHIAKEAAVRLIAEIFRVLRQGGAIRIVTPSLDNLCRLVIYPDLGPAQRYLSFSRRYSGNANATISDAVNRIFYEHGHRHLYTRDELTGLVAASGFRDVSLLEPGSYRNAAFNNVDGHGKIIGDDINALEAMAVEATKA